MKKEVNDKQSVALKPSSVYWNRNTLDYPLPAPTKRLEAPLKIHFDFVIEHIDAAHRFDYLIMRRKYYGIEIFIYLIILSSAIYFNLFKCACTGFCGVCVQCQ